MQDTAADANADQRAFWEAFAADWVAEARALEAMWSVFIPPILGAARLSPGQAVLDVGCGVGHLARAAAAAVGPGGRVTAVDISAPMLAGAAEIPAPGDGAPIEWLEADAQVHAFAPQGFDAVISRLGIMFFADPAAAFANIRAACRPGARISAMAWRVGADAPWFSVSGAAIADVLGVARTPDPHAPGPMAFAEIDRVEGILAAAGWREIATERVPLTLRPEGGLDGAMALQRRFGALGSLANSGEVDAATLDRIAETLRERLRAYVVDGRVEMPVAMNLFTARA